MTTQTQTENQTVKVDRNAGAETVVGFAIIGCLVAGAVGIDKALDMQNGWDVLLCLLSSVAAFGMVFYIYFRKD
jgi:hypothetical protein